MSADFDHISISQVNEWLGCQQQYFFHRIAEEKPIDVSSALIIGTAYHTAIQFYYEHRMKGENVIFPELHGVFEQALMEEQTEVEINWGRSNKNDQIEIAKNVFDAFLKGQSNNKVVSVEQMFRFDLEGLPIPIIGRTDLVEYDERDDSIIVVDFKSSATKPVQSHEPMVPSDLDANHQMTLYGMWAKHTYPGKRIKLRMDYLIKSKKNPAYLKLDTSRTKLQEESLSRIIKSTWNQIQMARGGVIEPLPVRSWKCSGCGYRDRCAA